MTGRAFGYLEHSRRLVRLRCHGVCEGCGNLGSQVHHRQARGMGGVLGMAALAAHAPANLLYLDDACHRFTLDEPVQARKLGWVIPHADVRPRVVPARLVTPNGVGWYLLDDEAMYHWVDEGMALELLRSWDMA